METNENSKKIIKYYLKARKYENNKIKCLPNLEKLIFLLNKKETENEKIIGKNYLDNIKKYTYENTMNIINLSLIKNSKYVSDDIFNLINEGNIDSITDTDNIYNYQIYDDTGLTPLHKCITLGDTTILKEFLKKGEKIDLVSKDGHTLLEFACLQKDPNLISFLLNHGADMKKHLYFRNKTKLKLQVNDIDTANIIKKCLFYKKQEKKIELDFLFNFIKPETEIGINNIKFELFKICLENLLASLPKETQDTIIDIWKDELGYQLTNKMGCPNNYLELILFNLVPFIDYPFNISNRNIITNELIYLIKHLSIKNNYLLDVKFNKSLINKIWKDYNEILPYDYIGVIISHIFSKFKK